MNPIVTITIKLEKFDNGTEIRTVNIEGLNIGVYEVIGVLNVTAQEYALNKKVVKSTLKKVQKP